VSPAKDSGFGEVAVTVLHPQLNLGFHRKGNQVVRIIGCSVLVFMRQNIMSYEILFSFKNIRTGLEAPGKIPVL